MSDKTIKTEAAKNAAPVQTGKAEYSVGEFAVNAKKHFGEKANADLVYAAFMVGNKTSATLSEAKDIVSKFMSKEVK